MRVERDAATMDRARAGLCADCAHAQRVESSRASVFFLCLKAASDPAFQKYPALPVRVCPGYERVTTAIT